MSGIAGIIHFDGKPVEPGLIEKMTGAMAHRGPDGINHWRKGSVALGQCMLRTTPESLEEHQPLTNEDESLVLAMDGRVDNWEDLRRELLGHGAVLRNRSDAELVMRAYEVWGEECPDRIIGEFVFFIWDAREQRVFGARDAAGTRHFYYHSGNGWFGFASEIKGLLALELIKPRLNESRLLDYLIPKFDRDDQVGTFYQDINRMPAGHSMFATERGAGAWRYWNPGNLPTVIFSSIDECADGLLEQLRIAIKCRLRSIGPVGAMLSGGLDSSSIVGLISKEFRSELGRPLRTFSLIREDRKNCPDWLSIREMLGDSGLEPTIITPSMTSRHFSMFIDHIRTADEPFVFTHGLGNFIIYEAARENGCRVVFEGMAGDLLFYGPDHTLESIFKERRYKHIPAMLAAYRRHGLDDRFRSFVRKCVVSITPENVRTVYRKRRAKHAVLGEDLKLLHPETVREFLTQKYNERSEAVGQSNAESDQLGHARYFTSGLLSFAHEIYGQIALSRGVEPRSPFSDRRMIEYAIQMPLEAKLCTQWYKHVLRKSMNGVLPEEIRWRRNMDGHPGWTFYERLITDMAQHAPVIWNLEELNILKKWLDVSLLDQDWFNFARNADYTAGYRLFGLVVLSRWLRVRPSFTQTRLNESISGPTGETHASRSETDKTAIKKSLHDSPSSQLRRCSISN